MVDAAVVEQPRGDSDIGPSIEGVVVFPARLFGSLDPILCQVLKPADG